MKQLKNPPKTNEELTEETIDAVETAFKHLKRFFNVFDGETDGVIEKVLVDQIGAHYGLYEHQKPRVAEIVAYALKEQ